jgi:LPPG:FO 2-phospho-L-lactate transferase
MKVVALSGGVGGARLLDGLAEALPAGTLTAIVNTGDDFQHLGLHISPDLDTVMYTLAGLAHEERGWGLAEESFHFLDRLKQLGGEDWFALGDRDLAVHVRRTCALAAGESLSEVTARMARALSVRVPLLPMSDHPAPTMIDTDEGTLTFQDWFVRRRAALRVKRVFTAGRAAASPAVMAALTQADLIVIGPSNPYVSIDPILALDGVRPRLTGKTIVALSPIVGGRAVKGPLAEMIAALTGKQPSAAVVAAHYGGLLSGMVIERGDEVPRLRTHATNTIMKGREDRKRLALELLAFAESLG